MWHRYVALIVVVTCVCFLVQAQSEMFQITEKRNSNKYCGTVLSDMLAMVCEGRYNEQKYKKSSYDSDSDKDYAYQQEPYLDNPKLPFPYRSRPNAAALLSGSFRRNTRGVIDECCRKPCTIPELRTYCSYQ